MPSTGYLWNLWSCCFAGLLTLPSGATACTADKMKTTDDGLLFKVVGASDKVEAKRTPDADEPLFNLRPLLVESECDAVAVG